MTLVEQSPVSVETAQSSVAWDAFVDAHPDGTVDHLWGWRDVVAEVFGHEPRYLYANRGGTVAGVLPLVLFRSRLFGRAVVSLPFLNYGGVLADDEGALTALVEAARDVAREFGAPYVELRHRSRQVEGAQVRSHKIALTRRIPATVDDLWKVTDRKVRNQVRKAQKEQLATEVGGSELVDAFYEVFSRNMRDLGTPVYSRQLFHQTLRSFPDRARVFIVRAGLRPVAAAIAIRHRDVVLVPWASSLREFRAKCPNMLLYWSMLERAVQDGVAVFDFGRSSPGGGTHQFKLQWGAEEQPLHWEYLAADGVKLPDTGADNPRFAAVIGAWQRLPLSVANLVGPAIVRHIP